jgi:hypothetical protein
MEAIVVVLHQQQRPIVYQTLVYEKQNSCIKYLTSFLLMLASILVLFAFDIFLKLVYFHFLFYLDGPTI